MVLRRVWPALVATAGCAQVFGLDDPRLGLAPPGVLVQQASGKQPSGTTVNVDLPAPPAAGDLLVATISTDTAIGTIQSISGGGSWAQIAAVPGPCSGCIRGAMWFAFASSADTTVTVDVGPSADDFVVSLAEWAGAAMLDTSATAGPDTTVNVSSGRVTAANNELVIAMGAWDQQDISAGPSGAFIALDQVNSGAAHLATAWQVTGGSGSTETSWTLAHTTQAWIGVIATFVRR